VFVSVALALAGLVGVVLVYGGSGERAALLGRSFPVLHRVLFGKYFVDEAYDRLITRPLYWISDRVFLRLGDQRILDGSLNGLAALGQRGAALLSRIQSGSLHLYALLVVAGIVASLAWSWRHG
jgi:NADH-quinone oxidoreductase subunit L